MEKQILEILLEGKNDLTGVQQGLTEVKNDVTEVQKDHKEVKTDIHVINETVNRN